MVFLLRCTSTTYFITELGEVAEEGGGRKTHVMRERTRPCKSTQSVHTGIALCQRRCRIEGRLVLVAFDIDTDGPIPVDGDSGGSFDSLVGAERALFIPHVVMYQEVLEPCWADAWWAPCLF